MAHRAQASEYYLRTLVQHFVPTAELFEEPPELDLEYLADLSAILSYEAEERKKKEQNRRLR